MLGATGAVLEAVERAHGGTSHAFAAVRPPGHHALADRVMGFCLVSNAVVAARRFQALGRRRVLIVDWDVHHGNGTQALVEHDADDPVRLAAPVAVVAGHRRGRRAGRGQRVQRADGRRAPAGALRAGPLAGHRGRHHGLDSRMR